MTCTQGLLHTGSLRTMPQEMGKLVMSPSESAGPIAAISEFSPSVRRGISSLIILVLHLSVVIALGNFIPIPGLDGWHTLVHAAEAVSGQELSVALKRRLVRGGLAALAFLGFYLMSKDVLLLLI